MRVRLEWCLCVPPPFVSFPPDTVVFKPLAVSSLINNRHSQCVPPPPPTYPIAPFAPTYMVCPLHFHATPSLLGRPLFSPVPCHLVSVSFFYGSPPLTPFKPECDPALYKRMCIARPRLDPYYLMLFVPPLLKPPLFQFPPRSRRPH